MKAKTSDERLVLALYEAAHESGDIQAPFDRYEIGKRVSLQPKGIDTICTLLLQANFIKKQEGKAIYLTKHGEALAKRLLSE